MLAPWKTNLDSMLKSRDITLPANVCIVKAMVFPVIMYGCESWSIKKADFPKIDAFQLWCWRRLLRVPWTARRSIQSILKEISPEYSLEGLMLKLQYFGYLMRRTDWFERPWCWEDWRREEKGTTEDEMVGWHYWLSGHEFEWTPGVGDGQGGLAVHGVTKSWTRLSVWSELNWREQRGGPGARKRRLRAVGVALSGPPPAGPPLYPSPALSAPSPHARPSPGGGAAPSGYPAAFGCFVFLAGTWRGSGLRTYCTGQAGFKTVSTRPESGEGEGPADWGRNRLPGWCCLGHCVHPLGEAAGSSQRLAGPFFPAYLLLTCFRPGAGEGDHLRAPDSALPWTSQDPWKPKITMLLPPASATSDLRKLTPGKEFKPAGPLGEGHGRARRARSGSHVFPVAGHPLHLTSPESGGAEFGVECAGLNQRKTEDSGWRHRGRSKAKDTGLLFLL